MKMTTCSIKMILTFAACLTVISTVRGAGDTNTATKASVTEDLGHDFFEGKTNKIARVYAVTPTHVQVTYEGVTRGRKIPRQSLPPQLAVLYPYDAEKAAEYQKQQMVIAGRQTLAQQEAIREIARIREQDLVNEIAWVNHQAAKLDADINLQKRLPKSKAKRATIENLVNQRQQVSDRLAKLQSQLDALKARQASMP